MKTLYIVLHGALMVLCRLFSFIFFDLRFMKKHFIFMVILAFVPLSNLFCQTLEIGGGPASSIAAYKDYRDSRAYTNVGLPNNEWYGISGVYLNAFEGSFLCFLFDKPKFMIGDYLRFGSGVGYMYSNVFDKIKDNGEVTLGYYGTYGNTEVYSPGPVDKQRLGFWLDINYGLQAQYKIDDYHLVGLRYYYRVHLNPSINYNGKGAAVWPSGVIGIFGNHKKFSGMVEFNLKKESEGGVEKYRGFLLRYHYNSSNPNRYWGIKVEHFKPVEDVYGNGSYKSIMILYGSAIFGA